ncbi:unannotated protein [freshwater metagenome]|uniref:Unannotated protein n=1 Tax=freshwater metagenome TaxID=449393 RepID=A0A6J5Z5D9_9ZZZZ|nr:hypothetical protein [Actinomycetota bacterium]
MKRVTLILNVELATKKDADAVLMCVAADDRVLKLDGTITLPVPMIDNPEAAARMAADDVRLRAVGVLPPFSGDAA